MGSMDKENTGQYGKKSALTLLKCYDNKPYPEDDDKCKDEENFLRRQGLMISSSISQLPVSDKAEAKRAYELGKVHLENCRMELALESFTFAVEFDKSVPQYWIDRAALCQKMNKHKEAWKDILSIEDEDKTVEVYKIGGKILTSLGQYVMGEKWLREALKKSDYNDEEALLLFQVARTKRLYQSVNVSQWPVQVKFTTESGKGVYAERKIQPGEVVFRDTPVVSAQTIDSAKKSPACAQCSRSLFRPQDWFGDKYEQLSERQKDIVAKHWPVVKIVPCLHCNREKYCSRECLENAWKMHHQFLCPEKNPAAAELFDFCERGENIVKHTWNSVFSPMMLARLWASVVSVTKFSMVDDMAETPTQFHFDVAEIPFRRFVSSGTAGYAKSIPNMVHMMANIFKSCDSAIALDITDEEFEKRYYQVACNAQSFSSTLYSTLIHGTFMARLTSEESDFYLLQQEIEGLQPPEDQVFGGLFQLQSCLNHSCDKNVDVMDAQYTSTQAGIEAKAIRLIEPGEEVCTVYVDTTLTRRLRRAWLLRAYNFMCECQRCRFEGDNGRTCCQCGATPVPPMKNFKACGKCLQAWYCSPQCQKIHWKAGHKKICHEPPKKGPSSLQETGLQERIKDIGLVGQTAADLAPVKA